MKTKELSKCFCKDNVDACREFYRRYFSAKVTFDCGWYVNLCIGGDGPAIQFMSPQENSQPLMAKVSRSTSRLMMWIQNMRG
jgi:hypothetical protein